MDYRAVLRELLKLFPNQAKLASELGVSQSTISKWLAGTQKIEADNRERIKALAIEYGIGTSDDGSPAKKPRRVIDGDVQNLAIQSGAGGGGALSVEFREDGDFVDPAMADGFWSFPEAKRCADFPVGSATAMTVNAQLYPDLGFGEFTYAQTGLITNYYWKAKVTRDGSGAKLSVSSGNTLNNSMWLNKVVKWADGNEDC